MRRSRPRRAGRQHGKGRPPGGCSDGKPDLALVGGRVEKQDVGTFIDIHLDAGHRLVDALGWPAVGARKDQDTGLLGRLHRRTDLHPRFFAWQAGLAGRAERARRDLILNQDSGGTGTTVELEARAGDQGVSLRSTFDQIVQGSSDFTW
jgi:hypothetical protein